MPVNQPNAQSGQPQPLSVSFLDVKSRSGCITAMEECHECGESSQQNIVESAPAVDADTVNSNAEAPECDEQAENRSPNINAKRISENMNTNVLKSSKKFASSAVKFQCFRVKWDKISDNVLSRLTDLTKFRNENPRKCAPKSLQLSKPEWAAVVAAVVYQLRDIDTEIGASVMEQVAIEILTKYPCLNFLDDDGFSTKKTFGWVKEKLVNRNYYLNRFKNGDEPATSSKSEVRQQHNMRAGTDKKYWEKTTKECTKDMLSVLARDEPEQLTTEFLELSQAYVRHRYDEKRPLKEVVSDFPVLRRKCLLDYHFERATGVSAKSLEQYFTAKRSKLIEFSKTKRKIPALATTATDEDIFRFLCRLLGENFEDVVVLKEIGTKIDGISIDCAGPVLVAVDCGNDRKVYYVFTEQARLSEGTENVIDAMSDLLCVHYVHNFMYMRQISKFLEFVQEYFFKILPEKGSKSTATRKGQQQRVVSKVIKDISAFCA